MADYLVGGDRVAPRAVLASGLTCEGGFSQLMRFSAKPEAAAVPLSELATVALDAAGRRVAGLVIAGETAGLCGAQAPPVPGARRRAGTVRGARGARLAVVRARADLLR